MFAKSGARAKVCILHAFGAARQLNKHASGLVIRLLWGLLVGKRNMGAGLLYACEVG